jgi:ribosomal protein S18 acetylase RimI-like enzyme
MGPMPSVAVRRAADADAEAVGRLLGQGLGRALMDAVLLEARARGADTIDLGTSETDEVARHLYERMGFTNREGGGDGPVMYVYEREL